MTAVVGADRLTTRGRQALVDAGGPLAWQWCYAADIAYAQPAPFHVDALTWGWELEPDRKPDVDAYALVVFRGGAKSATAETIAAMCAARRTRRYILVVSATQDLADDHVASIGGILASPLLRADYPHLRHAAVKREGVTEVWRHNRIRTGGVTIDAVGLNVNVRGARLGQYRPDLIVIDDVDSRHDSLGTAAKKVATITESVIPAGSENLAVLVAQNMPNDHGFVARLVDRTAPYMVGAKVVGPVPAVEGLVYESRADVDGGAGRWRITAGTPTWPGGYGLARAEADLNLESPDAFEAERQHNRRQSGGMFNPETWRWCDVSEVPAGTVWCRGWDFAASESEKNDRSASVLLGQSPSGRWWVTDASAGWWPVSLVELQYQQTAASDGRGVMVDIPKDPAQAGKDQAERRAGMLAGWRVHVSPQTGSKAVRAEGVVAQQQAGNVSVVRGHPVVAQLVAECDAFRGGDQGAHDDLVDALSGAFNALAKPARRGGLKAS